MSGSADPLVTQSSRGDVTVLTLNDPSRLNAISVDMVEALRDAVEQAARSARAIILTGSGRAFCSGANLTMEMDRESPDYDAGALLESHYNPLMLMLHDLEIPLVTAVNGPAAGIGCSLALAGDIILAAANSYFLLAFDRVGLVPDGGATWLLPRAVGRARAAEMMLLGDRIEAGQALEWGLVNRVAAGESLMKEAHDIAERLAGGPTDTLGMVKRIARAAAVNDYAAQLGVERVAQRDAGRTPSHREGIAAFRERRPAQFGAPRSTADGR
jgi:2-(1,2-epoxy-1,2-dihydrophenyl)acetyl-CoA isomerase